MNVGIRELRANLSRYVKRVEAGEEVTVTDHGRVVARLVPAKGESVIDRLIREGKITPARRPKGPPPKPIKAKGTISDLVLEDRR